MSAINNVFFLVWVFIYFSNLNILTQSKESINININILRNNTLRYFVFREEKMLFFYRNIRNKIQNKYYNMLVNISEGIDKYNSLSHEDKLLIETMIDLII